MQRAKKTKFTLTLILCLFEASVSAIHAEDPFPYASQNPAAPYRLFNTHNIFTLLKLDTVSGLIWQVQWAIEDDHRFYRPLNLIPLAASSGEPGRFTLYPTQNIFNFILLDQKDGRMWQVYWGAKPSGDGGIIPIPDAAAAAK